MTKKTLSRKRIVVGGYYGYGNLGDELILKQIIASLTSQEPDLEIVVLSGDPAETRKTHSVKALKRWNFLRVFWALSGARLFVLGGGGLLQDKTSFYSLVFYLTWVGMARILRCPVFLYAVGVETVKRKWGRKLVRWVLLSTNVVISVRDTPSKSLLVSFGLTQDRIFVTGDPVFGIKVGPGVPPEPKESKRVLLIPRFPVAFDGVQLFNQVLKDLLGNQNLILQGFLFQPQRERKYLEALGRMRIWKELTFLQESHFGKILDVFSKQDYVISARYHGLVLAAIFNKPFLGIGDSDKVGRLCEAWGMPFIDWNSGEGDIHKVLGAFLDLSETHGRPLQSWQESAELTPQLLRRVVRS